MQNTIDFVQVINMVDHTVSYTIPEMNIVRRFDPFEAKNLPVEEIIALNYKRGGHRLLQHYLCVKDDELKEIIGIPEDLFEYDYSEEDIERILLEDHEDVLRDTLDFAPQGIIELVKSKAFKLKIPDTNKRQIIFDMTGTDVDTQIKLQEMAEKALAEDGVESATQDKEEQPRRRRRVPVKK